MSLKESQTLSDFFYSCEYKSSRLFNDFLTILTDKLNKDKTSLIAGTQTLSLEEQKLLTSWIEKKKEDYPLQYFLNEVSFCDALFYVDEGVLIPRMETEEIVLQALKKIKSKKLNIESILDIGSGSGCMGISAAMSLKTCKELILIEPSDEAQKALDKNISRHRNKINSIELVSKTFEEVELDKNSFDLILSNPPYIAIDDPDVQNSVYVYEPHMSLFGGVEPTELIYSWVCKAFEMLSGRGLMFFEFSHDQKEKLEIALNKFKPIFFKDSFGKDRFFMIDKSDL